MMSPLDRLLNLPGHLLHPWAYWIAFLISFLEPLPFFGSFFPGQLTIILCGLLVKEGKLDFTELACFAAAGAMLGDLAGYLLGYRYGEALIARFGKRVLLKKERFEKLKILLIKYAGRTIILGRFNSFTRSFSPILAGMARIPLPKFFIFDVLGGVAWALAFVSVGFFFGKGYKIGSKYLGDIVFISLLLGAVIVLLYRAVYKRKRIFERRHLKVLILNVVSLYLFAKMWEDVRDGELVTKWDLWVNRKTALLSHALPLPVLKTISVLALPIHVGILAGILFIYLLLRKQWSRALLLFISMSAGALLNRWFEALMPRRRPFNALIGGPGNSFPSSVTEFSVLFCAVAIYLVYAATEKRTWRVGVSIAGFVLVSAIVGSRIFLNADWCTDEVAGLALGVFWVTLLILIYRFFSSSILTDSFRCRRRRPSTLSLGPSP